MRKTLRYLLFPLLIFPAALMAQTSNTFYARSFPGPDVATKVTEAQNACTPNLTCVIVIDSVLAAFPAGTMPTQCALCVWNDYRTTQGSPGSCQTSTGGCTFSGPLTATVNNLINVAAPPYNAVANGCGVGGTDQTSKFLQAIAAAQAAHSGILIPATALPFQVNSLAITGTPISVQGQGYQLSTSFPAFGGGFTATGSVVCSTQTSGAIFSYKPLGTGVANGLFMKDFYVEGPGVQGTATAITSISESGSLGTAILSSGVTVPSDTQVYITGNSVPQYNGIATVQSSSSGSFTFYVRSFVTGLGTGTGGTATQESTCIAIGDSVNVSYPTHFTTDNLGGGNCGVGVAMLVQDSRFSDFQLGGDFADGFFGDGTPTYTLNTTQFMGGVSINDHIQFDMAMGGSSLLLTGWDFETPPLNDSTAQMIYWDAVNSLIGPENYYEAYNTNLFTGDGIFLPKAVANYNVKIEGGQFGLGTGANAAIEIAGGGDTTVDLWHGRVFSPATAVLIDSGAAGQDAVVGLLTCSQITNNGSGAVQAFDTSGNICAASTVTNYNNQVGFLLHGTGDAGGSLNGINCWICVTQDTSNDPILDLKPNANSTSAMIREINTGNTATVYQVDQSGDVTETSVKPSTLFSAAGTALPTCSSSLNGQQYTVSDATSPTFLGSYTSGGAVTATVICNGTGGYSWKTY